MVLHIKRENIYIYVIHVQVALWVKAPQGISYMYVNNNEHIVVRHKIPDPDSSQGMDTYNIYAIVIMVCIYHTVIWYILYAIAGLVGTYYYFLTYSAI